MELKFCCPECGGTSLEEIMTRAHVATAVQGIDHESGELWYGEVAVSDGVVERFQCQKCGYHLLLNGSPVITEIELRDWLLDNIWVSYKESDNSRTSIIEVWASDHWTKSVWAFTPYATPPTTLVQSVTQREFLKLLERKDYLGQ